MDRKDQRAAISKPSVQRLKDLGAGMKVSQVMGTRLLIQTIIPWTDMDRVEKEGLLVLPESVKSENTPTPSTGIVIQLGPMVAGHPDNRRFIENPNDSRAFEDIIIEGTCIMFSKFAGIDFTIANDDYKIIELREVMCTFEVEEGSIALVKGDAN